MAATRRVLADLRDLFDAPPAAQGVTPLQLVRRAVAEPTAVLAGAGVPPVARDAFEERALPDDRYDLAPRALRDLGDEALGPVQLAWGMAKAAVLGAGPAPR